MTYSKNDFSASLKGSVEWLRKELSAIRTGRAAPSLLDGVRVECYGSMMEIAHVATISLEDAKTIRIAPFDSSTVKPIEKAIIDADLGVSVSVDGSGMRVIFPELTAERRQLFVKAAKEKLEESRISIRQERQKAIDAVQDSKKNNEIGEDDVERLKKEIQGEVDKANEELEQIFQKKEKEITE
jgi:ribosome recycling factor